MYVEAEQCLAFLEDPLLKNNEAINLEFTIQNSEGIGIVEAPRGTLIHHYHLNSEHELEEVKLFIATEINIPLINQMLTDFSIDMYDRTGDMELINQNAQMIIRAFDPCISCATH